MNPTTTPPSDTPIIVMEKIVKRFGDVTVLNPELVGEVPNASSSTRNEPPSAPRPMRHESLA